MKKSIDYSKIYSEKALVNIRSIIENEYRQQYEIACKFSNLMWEEKFKVAFENLCESISDLDDLFN